MSNIGGPSNSVFRPKNNSEESANNESSHQAFGRNVKVRVGRTFVPQNRQSNSTDEAIPPNIHDRSPSRLNTGHFREGQSPPADEKQRGNIKSSLAHKNNDLKEQFQSSLKGNTDQYIHSTDDNLPEVSKNNVLTPEESSLSIGSQHRNAQTLQHGTANLELKSVKEEAKNLVNSHPDGASPDSPAKKKWLGKLKKLCDKVLKFITDHKISSLAAALFITGLLMTIPVAGQFFGASLIATLTFSMGMILLCSSMGLTLTQVMSPDEGGNNSNNPTAGQNTNKQPENPPVEPAKPLNNEEGNPVKEEFTLDRFKNWINSYPPQWFDGNKLLRAIDGVTKNDLSTQDKQEAYDNLLKNIEGLIKLIESPLDNHAGEDQSERIKKVQEAMKNILVGPADLELNDLIAMTTDFGGLIEAYKRFYPTSENENTHDSHKNIAEILDRLKGINSALQEEFHQRIPNTGSEAFGAGGPSIDGQLYAAPLQKNSIGLPKNISSGEKSLNEKPMQYGSKIIAPHSAVNPVDQKVNPASRGFFSMLDLYVSGSEEIKDYHDIINRLKNFPKFEYPQAMPEHSLVGLSMSTFFVELKSACIINWQNSESSTHKTVFEKKIANEKEKKYYEFSIKLVAHTMRERAFSILGISEDDNNTFEQDKKVAIANTHNEVKKLFIDSDEKLILNNEIEGVKEKFINLLLDSNLGEGIPTVDEALNKLHVNENDRNYIKSYIKNIMSENWWRQ